MNKLAQSFSDLEVYQESFRLQQEIFEGQLQTLKERAAAIGRLPGSTITARDQSGRHLGCG